MFFLHPISWIDRQLSNRGIKLEPWAIWALWVGALLVALWALNYAPIFNVLGQMLPAVFTTAGAVAIAILTHLFAQLREQENQQRRALQDNYMEVLGDIGVLIRERAPNDKFSGIHLKTRVVGSKTVIEASKRLMEVVTDGDRCKALDDLIAAMRTDVGMGKIDVALPKTIFMVPKAPGGLNPEK
jgi:hypothetical protein